MRRTVKYTAFATNSKTGERGHGSGELTVDHWVSDRHVTEAIRRDLDRQGFTDVAIDNHSIGSER